MSDVSVTFGAKDQGLAAAFARVKSEAGSVQDKLAKVVGAAAAVTGAFMALKSSLGAVRAFADFAGQMSDMSAKTGLTTSEVLILGQAFENAGLSTEGMGKAVKAMQNALVDANGKTGPAAEAFAKLGLNVDDLINMPADKAIATIGREINKLGTDAEKTSIATDIFSKAGQDLLAVFKDTSALETARTQIGGLAENLGITVNELDAFSDALQAAEKNKGMQFMAGFAKAFAGDIEGATNAINAADFSKPGVEMGLVAKGAKLFADDINRAAEGLLKITENLPGIKQGLAAGLSTAARAVPGGATALAAMDIGNALKDRAAMANMAKPQPMDGKAVAAAEEVATGMSDAERASLSAASAMWELKTAAEDANRAVLEHAGLWEDGKDQLEINAQKIDEYIQFGIQPASDAQRILTELSQEEAEARKESAKAAKEAAAAFQTQALQSASTTAQGQLAGAQQRLATIASAPVSARDRNANRLPKAEAVGKKGSMKRNAQKAFMFDEQADQAEAFGDTAKADKLRKKASDARAKAFPSGQDDTQTLEQIVGDINKTLTTLEKKLPFPALAP